MVKEASVEQPSVEVRVSAVRGDGLLALRQLLVEAAYSGVRAGAETPSGHPQAGSPGDSASPERPEAFVNARDAGLLPEIAATHLLDAEPALEELLGVVETEDVLDVVFSSFCIGK